MKTYRWLLFDADGTLFDYAQAEVNALQQSFTQLGLPYKAEYLAEYQHINLGIWAAFEQGELSQDDLKVKRFELFLRKIQLAEYPEPFSQRYLANLAQASYLIDGAEALVKSLATRYSLAIITNGLKEVQRSRLEKSSIYPYIKTIIVSDEIGVAKPAPEIFDVAFAAMDHPDKEETLIIGDSLSSDMTGGVNYGIDTCWYNPQRKQLDHGLDITYEINNLAELKTLLAA